MNYRTIRIIISLVVLTLLIHIGGFAQDKAQDADRHQLNQPRSTISPQGEGDPYNPFWASQFP